MNVTILINSKQYADHLKKAAALKASLPGHAITLVDMADPLPLHEIYAQILHTAPKLILTLDGAGFELRTELDTPTLFKIPCRGIHFLFDEKEVEKLAAEDFYLGHILCLPQGTDPDKFCGTYKNIPDAALTPDFTEESLKTFFMAAFTELKLS